MPRWFFGLSRHCCLSCFLPSVSSGIMCCLLSVLGLRCQGKAFHNSMVTEVYCCDSAIRFSLWAMPMGPKRGHTAHLPGLPFPVGFVSLLLEFMVWKGRLHPFRCFLDYSLSNFCSSSLKATAWSSVHLIPSVLQKNQFYPIWDLAFILFFLFLTWKVVFYDCLYFGFEDFKLVAFSWASTVPRWFFTSAVVVA